MENSLGDVTATHKTKTPPLPHRLPAVKKKQKKKTKKKQANRTNNKCQLTLYTYALFIFVKTEKFLYNLKTQYDFSLPVFKKSYGLSSLVD